MTGQSIKEDDTFVIHGQKSNVPLSQVAVGKEILKCLIAQPKNSVAMIDAFTHEKLLHPDLLQKAVNLAVALRYCDYSGQSTVLSISSENCLNFFIPVFASFFNGSIMAPLNHTYTTYELEHTLNISRPKVVFCSNDVAENIVELKEKLTFVERIIILEKSSTHQDLQSMEQFIGDILNGKNIDVKTFQPVIGKADKLAALIMCSSGTTGLPKGVTLSHLSLNVQLAHSRDPQYHLQHRETVLGLMPFFHAYGLLTIFTSLLNAKPVVCLKRFDDDVFLKSIQDYKIYALSLAPPLAVYLAKTDKLDEYDLSSVKSVFCGAAPLSKSIEEVLKARLKCDNVRQAYGLTEATLAVTIVGQNAIRPGSCGKVISFLSVKVRDPGTGRSLGPKKVGEICLKGPTVMMGYYNNDEATREAFTSDGWLRTGDLGYYDKEGYFYIIDRLKELIKYKGFQVAPAELEAILLTHPKIGDAGVVGLPDEIVGERPLAFVVKKPEADVTEKEIAKYVADLVSPQKRLSGGVIFVDYIPKSVSGKILRKDLREMLKEYKNIKIDSKL